MKVDGVREIPPAISLKAVSSDGAESLNYMPSPERESENVKKEEKIDPKSVDKAVDLLNKTMEDYSTELKFVFHKGSGEYMVKVINTKDNSVIREIPPEKVLDMVAYFKDMLGMIVDKFI